MSTAFDPILLEVFVSRFDMIAQEMQSTLIRSAYSIILKEAGDCSCAVFLPSGEMITQSTSNPIHLALFVPAFQNVTAKYPLATWAEGDVYIMNDPYAGGSHIPDLIIFVPTFYEGRVVAVSAVNAHHQDVGGKSPGSMVVDATDIFQEGLAIPPEKLYDKGELNETLWSMIDRNVREPRDVFGDLMAEVAAGNTAALRIRELLERYGVPTFEEVTLRLLEHSEKLTRHEIEKIPDGTYEFTDYIDHDGVDLDRPLHVTARVTIAGSEMHVDFEGTSSQTRGPANVPPGAAIASVYFVVRAITRGDIPNNSGCYRPIKVKAPLGTVLNPRRPAPVSIRFQTLTRAVDAMLGALAAALPEQIPAAMHGSDMCFSVGGVDPGTSTGGTAGCSTCGDGREALLLPVAPPGGRTYMYMDCSTGGRGASWHADGVDNLSSCLGNPLVIPAEAAELEIPLRVWAQRLRADSGGGGTWRGGRGIERVVELLRGHGTVTLRCDRFRTSPWGLRQGRAGARFSAFVDRKGGQREMIPGRKTFPMRAGDRLTLLTGGGGGYGPAWERPAEVVREDVLDRTISVQAAHDAYGVVLTPDKSVDGAATASRRAQLAAGADTSQLFDRGPGAGYLTVGELASVVFQPAARETANA